MSPYLSVLISVLIAHLAQAAPQEDLVTDLPGLSFKPNFKHYSGYLNGVATRRLHYWFVESSSNPSRDPLVLWLNGGPGCSSVLGLLTEHGPFMISEDAKTVVQNPFSWNQAANMIYLESPAGVGFSYDTAKNYSSNDDDTAMNNYYALKSFFKKFPEYNGRDFYITGESYGGIYVPTLTMLVMKDSAINLQGFAVGNGLSDDKLNDNSLIYFVYYHGLIGENEWNGLLKDCCPVNSSAVCDFASSTSDKCRDRLERIQGLVWASGLNVYNLYKECYGGVQDLTLRMNEGMGNKFVTSNFGWPFMFLENTGVSQRRKKMLSLPAGSLTVSPPCVGDQQVVKYLNEPAVKEALHISKEALEWTMCSSVLHYERQYNTMTPQYEAAIQKKLRILVYNGDVDMACNFLGDEWFVDSLHPQNPQQRKAWYYKAADGTTQNAGFVKSFDQITFVTVKGSGHMVPTDKPRPGIEMFINFIQNKPF
ncbi:carboxypeptidase [Plakobranchus ocellatus]|uniref:Carboxypeptidase n=1 Tax=Plakobranchus ocellatus TaxID=259542 RepID=A0AAV4A279_9GAST|nr:carboxypeptidase [Plakobranchus ocellatus]